MTEEQIRKKIISKNIKNIKSMSGGDIIGEFIDEDINKTYYFHYDYERKEVSLFNSWDEAFEDIMKMNWFEEHIISFFRMIGKKIYDDTMAFNTPIETPERPFFDFDDAFAYINELCMFETNNEKDWSRKEFDNFYYFKLEKWKKVTDSNKMIKKCEWYIINQKPVYFKRWDYSRHLRLYANDSFETSLTEGQDLNIPHPFHAGDILKVDMRPFMPERNLLLLEKGNGDCCSMQVAYIDEYDKLCTGAFKHSDISNYYLYRNHPICSPFFTLTKENVVLKESEKVLLDLQKEINGNETKGREVFNRIINW